MAGPLLYDRAMATTTGTGTGALTLGATVTGYQALSVVGNTNTFPYAIWDVDDNGVPDGDWEVGIGTYSSTGPTITRTLVLSSSNSGSAVNFGAGTKYVALTMNAAMSLPGNDICNGRLTTESGVPVSSSDRTAQGTIYWTPYKGNRISLWNGSGWAIYAFSQVSLGLTVTSGKNYDVFIYNNSGTLTLELSNEWTDDTTRDDSLTTQDGVIVKNAAPTRRWLGTIRASGSNVTADSGGNAGTTQVGGQRFVWNYYSQVPRNLKVIDTTDNWTYTNGTIRQADGASGNKVEYVTGDAALLVSAEVIHNCLVTGSSTRVANAGVGVDSTTTFAGLVGGNYFNGGNASLVPLAGFYKGYPGLGYHYLSWNEKGSDGTTTFYGDESGGGAQSGLTAWLMG